MGDSSKGETQAPAQENREASSFQRFAYRRPWALFALRQLMPASPVVQGQCGKDSCVLATSGMLETAASGWETISHSFPFPSSLTPSQNLPGL